MTTGSGHGQVEQLDHPVIDKAFEETMSLLAEARDYATRVDRGGAAANDAHTDSPQSRLRERAEAFRVTARLANVMVWLLVQRAVRAGEVAAGDETPPTHRLGDRRVCTDDGSHRDPELSQTLRDLLQRSHALYCRVMRLDDMQAAQRSAH